MTKKPTPTQPARTHKSIALPKILQALSDPVRLEILLLLSKKKEISCGSFGIAIPKSSLSHHFKVLREAGLIESRREGNELINSLRKKELELLFPGLIESVLNAACASLHKKIF
jgi:DNA-binding transcriptional ArsR family regulator